MDREVPKMTVKFPLPVRVKSENFSTLQMNWSASLHSPRLLGCSCSNPLNLTASTELQQI